MKLMLALTDKVKESKVKDNIRNESEVYKTEVKESKENDFQLDINETPLVGVSSTDEVGSSEQFKNVVLNGLKN